MRGGGPSGGDSKRFGGLGAIQGSKSAIRASKSSPRALQEAPRALREALKRLHEAFSVDVAVRAPFEHRFEPEKEALGRLKSKDFVRRLMDFVISAF